MKYNTDDKKRKRIKLQYLRRAHTQSVYQIEASECGAACLSMILQFYHCTIPMERIRYECGVSRDGCNMADMVRAAGIFGLRARGFKKTAEQLREMPVPCILHWNFDHFVVLEGIRKNKVYLNDPATGHRTLTLDTFNEKYTGVVLCFEQTKDFLKNERTSGLFKLIIKRLSKEKSGVWFMLLTGLLLVVPGLLTAILTQGFVDAVLLRNNPQWAKGILIILTFTFLFQVLLNWLKLYVLSRMKIRMSMVTNYQLLYKIFRLPLTFFEQRYAGELSERVETNNSINNFLAGIFSETVLNILQASCYLTLMLLYSRVLTLIGVVGVIISIGISLFMLRPLAEMNAKAMQDKGKMEGMLCAGISASATIKASGVENEFTSDILSVYAQNTKSEQKRGWTQEILRSVSSSVGNVFQVTILIVGGYFVINGECTTGVLTAFSQLLVSFVSPVNTLIGISQQMQDMKAGLARVEDIEAAEEDFRYHTINDVADITLPHKLSGSIKVERLVFGYNPGLAPIVKGYSLQAYPGSRIAIVGASGCGKSTVGKLLSGMLSPWEGSISYDDIPLADISPAYLCESLSVIGQNTVIFSGTIRENLTLWKTGYPESEILHATMDAEANEMINSLPGAYDYRLDEGGRNLSGGQRQKIAIARALINDPSILIMDESTSALDAATEKQILDHIRCRGCTCIMIAHRLSTIRDCDLIMVMEDGRVAECGTHDQLIRQNGIYSRLIDG